MRISGCSFHQIADQLGYKSRGAAAQDLTRALEARIVEQRQSVDLLQHITDEQLCALLAGVGAKAIAGDVRAGEQALRVIDRRCKLHGLDAAQQLNVLGGWSLEQMDAEIRRLESELGVDSEQTAIGAAPSDPPVWTRPPQEQHPWGTQLPRAW